MQAGVELAQEVILKEYLIIQERPHEIMHAIHLHHHLNYIENRMIMEMHLVV